MRAFGLISSRIWRSQKFSALPDDFAKLFYVYSHTVQHGNATGCFYLPPASAADDLGKSIEEIVSAIKSCEAVDLIHYDWDNNFIQIRYFFKFNKIDNNKHAIGAVRQALSIPDSQGKADMLKDLVTQKHIIADHKLRALVENELNYMAKQYPSDTGMKPVLDTETDTETKTETKTKTERVQIPRRGVNYAVVRCPVGSSDGQATEG